MKHIIAAFLIQVLFSPLSLWLGAMFVVGYYLGREMAQAEYRVINGYYGGKRANMPWWGALQARAWTTKSVCDWVLPSFVVILAASFI